MLPEPGLLFNDFQNQFVIVLPCHVGIDLFTEVEVFDFSAPVGYWAKADRIAEAEVGCSVKKAQNHVTV